MSKRVRRAAAMAAVAVAVWVGPADAQSVYTGVQPPVVGSVDVGSTQGGQVLSTQGGQVLSSSGVRLQAVQATQSNRSGLAFTGTDVIGLVAIGGGAIAIGLLLKRRADA